ncbi:MAG: YHS domain-containing protein [Planctomycetes bacterium]|nr:YHS domain-containing protein [Planctomycetota bacterium]
MFKHITVSMSLLAFLGAGIGCGSKDEGPKHDGGHEEPAKHEEHATAPPAAPIAETVVDGKARDPICGMVIPVLKQPEFVYRQTRFHFCSDMCLGKFKAASAKATTGLPGESCVCTAGGMANCKCGHCKGKPERCLCGDPETKKGDSGGHEGHEHDHDDH